MPTWILATLFAAFMQNLRFLLQRHLKVTTLSTMGATWARFAFALPFVALALAYTRRQRAGVPPQPRRSGAISRRRHRADAGDGLRRGAVRAAQLRGGDHAEEDGGDPDGAHRPRGAGGGRVDPGRGGDRRGVSGRPFVVGPAERGPGRLSWRERVFNAASGYGLASGLLFGISAVCYRGATLSLPHGDAVIRAGVALLAATVVQTATLGLWLAMRERGEIGACWRHGGWRCRRD
jgi:hypothetical protein